MFRNYSIFIKEGMKCNFSSVGVKSGTRLKSFEDIPGPFSLPFIGTAWKYFPVVGQYNHLKLHEASKSLNEKYGPIVKENVGSFNIVRLYDPKDFETIHKLCAQDNTHIRLSFFELKKYRESKPHIYKTPGLLPLNGDGWWKLRKVAQKPISPVKEARSYLTNDDAIIKEFVHEIAKEGTIDDFLILANRLNTETTLKFLFGERFNCFSTEGMKPNSIQSNILNDALNATETFGYFDRALFLWTRPTSSDYRKIHQCYERTEKFTLEQIEKVRKKGNAAGKCLVSEYIKDKEFNENELGSIIDLLYGGIDTTAITSSYLLSEVSRNEKIQETLREEASRLLPQGSNSQITEETLNQASYTKAVLKETLRLHPIISAQNRKIPKDVNLSGFKVPKDTLAVLEILAACRLENNFKDAATFKPERWIKSSDEYEESNPYVMLPFGLGLRTCIGRRRAEQLIQTLVLRIFSEYKVKSDDIELRSLTPFLYKPEKPIKLSLKKI